MKFEEKLEEIISRAKKVQNITKEVSNLDQKVAFGLTQAKTDIEHYGIVFEKNLDSGNYYQQDDTLTQLYKLYANPALENLEYLTITFDKLKRSSEKFALLSNSDNDVVLLSKAIKIPVLTEGSLSVEFEASKIYETENLTEVFKMYKAILLKEKQLASENASRLRDKLMSL